jgi:hypothetical protein
MLLGANQKHHKNNYGIDFFKKYDRSLDIFMTRIDKN